MGIQIIVFQRTEADTSGGKALILILYFNIIIHIQKL